jgi:mono/diheme cytochrome c family protein
VSRTHDSPVASAFRRNIVLLLFVPLLAGFVPQEKSVWDGVYTDEQARRGEALYGERCVRCHGPGYMGGTDGATALVGPTFNGNWNGVTLDQMLDRVRLTMPQDKPASLSRAQTADALAFILSINKIPSGKTELPRQAEILALIRYTAAK